MAGLLRVIPERIVEVSGAQAPVQTIAAHANPESKILVRLVLLQPGAQSVAVAGDFNGWNPEQTKLEWSEGGMWTVTIPLKPGRYQYMFVIDGKQWIADPWRVKRPATDLERRMRCLMSVSERRTCVLASYSAVGYSAAHDERIQNRDVERGVGHERLCLDDQARCAQAGDGRGAVYLPRADGQYRVRRGFVQRMGQESHTHEANG